MIITEFIDDVLEAVIRRWGLVPGQFHRGWGIAGSPERCRFRVVVEEATGGLFILENLARESVPRKLAIIRTLAWLEDGGLRAIQPYLSTRAGEPLVETVGGFWQLRAFAAGAEPPRPDYIHDQWRGAELADFLLDLRRAAEGMPEFDDSPPFSIIEYIPVLLAAIEKHRPPLLQRVHPVVQYVEQALEPVHRRLPLAFCHGDYHPLNVIWSSRGINAVIDWEFAGLKPELYDAANLVGCTGFEHPSGLSGELVRGFLGKLHAAGFASERSWRHFFDLLFAIRFGWLSEWLRKKDEEMLELELVFMQLLLDNRSALETAWGANS